MTGIHAIIQSSWRSDILEYKSLIKLSNDKTVLETIVLSLKKISLLNSISLATSDCPEDRLLIREAERLGISTYAGDDINVLGRLRNASCMQGGIILKVDGNKPLFDYVEAEKLIHEHINGKYEYSYNGHYLHGVLYGTDCEVINAELFEKVNISTLSLEQLESGTVHFRAHPESFKIHSRKYANPRNEYRVILEEKRDIDVINHILRNVYSITNDAIISFLDVNPIISRHNRYGNHKEVGLGKILLFPDKIQSMQNTERDHPDPTYPISVELSFTNRCNLNCIWCSDKQLRARQEDDMPLETIERLAVDLAANGTRGVVIEGGGEPTIIKNFEEAVDLFKREGLALGLITNGSVRIRPHVINKFDWIRVSLDASCPDEMKALKGHDYFEDIISNITHYAKHIPVVGIGYVVTNQNLSQVESLILRIKDSGVAYIQFRPVIDYAELKPDVDLDYFMKFQTQSFAVITDGMRENVVRGNNGVKCRCHSISTVISADGSVFLCGRLNIYPWMKPIGNINQSSFYDIWHGDERKRQAAMVGDEMFCTKNCPECRITKFNIEFDHLDKIVTKNFI